MSEIPAFPPAESVPQPVTVYYIERPRQRYWLHGLLLAATLVTTLLVGARLQYNFSHALPMYNVEKDFFPISWILQQPSRLLLGLPFALTLLAILLAHELGHYFYCWRYHIAATLPFFIPAPTFIGTFGAVIRIKSPIYSREALFDVGIAGPIAGMLVAVPVLAVGLLLSHPMWTGISESDVILGYPLIFHLVHWLLNAVVPGYALHGPGGALRLSGVYMHPIAVAAWVGMLATALNLIPGGQLDGGHIVYAVQSRLHRPLGKLMFWVLLLCSWYWAGWLLWCLVLLFIGRRHPSVPELAPLSAGRQFLAVVALLLLLLTFAPAPILGGGFRDMLRDAHWLR